MSASIQDALLSTRALVVVDILPHFPSWRALLMVIPLFFQLLLLHPPQTEATRLARIAIVPIGIYLAFQVTKYDFVPRDAFRPYNFIKNLAFPIGVSKTLEYAFVKQRYFWIGHSNARAKTVREERPPTTTSPISIEAARSAAVQLLSHRGQGWSWGIKGDLIPPAYPEQHFILHALQRVIRSHILLVLVMSTIQYSQQHGSANSDFLGGLGLPAFPYRWVLADLALAVTFGTAVWNFLECGFSEVTIGAYVLTKIGRMLPVPKAIKPDPFEVRSWPPLLRNPLRSTSLADWWTYRWHSVLRRMFVVMGFKPARYLTSWAGKDVSAAFGVLGAFFISGVLHELCLYLGTSELPLDPRLPSIRFFMAQGAGLVAEQVFTRSTGRQVGGWPGRLWLVLVLGFPGASLTKAWLGRGLLDHQPTPDTWEWWRWCIPMVSYVPRLVAK